MGMESSLEAVLGRIVREAVADVLRAELAPLAARLDALAAAAPPALVDVAEAARRLGVSTATARRMVASGELPAVRLGRAYRIDLAAIPRPARPEQIGELAARARRTR